MQRTERGNRGRGFSARHLPRRAFDGRRIQRAAAGGRSACGRQAPARTAQRGRKGPEAPRSFKITFAGMYVLGANGIKATAAVAREVARRAEIGRDC